MKTQGIIDARTLHQSVRSRLVREQREGLRDNRGSLLSSTPPPSPLESPASKEGQARGPRREGELRQEGLAGEGEGENEAAGEDANEDAGEDAHDNGAAGMGSTKESGDETFSFLASGFDESDLGGMRTPPFPLPRVVIGDGHVQVTLPAKL